MLDEIKRKSINIGSLVTFLNRNVEYLNYVNSNIPKEVLDRKIPEKVYYLVNEISDPILCLCGKHKSFIGFKNGYRETCGDKSCYVLKRKKTCIDRFGVDNPKKSEEVIKKEQEKIKERWGGNHYMKSIEISDKFKKTMKSVYGVEFAQQSDLIKEKSKESFKNNPNKEDIKKRRINSLISKTDKEKEDIELKKVRKIEDRFGSYENFINYRLEKIKEKSLKRFGTDHHLKSVEVIDKRIKSYKANIINKILDGLPENLTYIEKNQNINNTDSILTFYCSECEDRFSITRQFFHFRKSNNSNICLNCNPTLSGKSRRELEVYDFIKEVYSGEILTNLKGVITGELDIFVPSLNLAFEFNGLYWHSDLYKDKLYHINKTKECIDKGIKLFHIWEDDWDFKKDIIKSMIMNRIGKSERIFARKCSIRIVDNNIASVFLEKNHIQGFVGSKVRIGLFLGEELVSLMTFGSLRRSLGNKSELNNWELLRFCNKLGTTVVGGFSRLFKYFIKSYSPEKVISYSDSSRSNGDMYNQLGFYLEGETVPNYYWIINGVRKHRFNFRKDKLIREVFDNKKTEVQIMNQRGYFRVFDCGSRKWIFLNNI